MSPNRVDHNKEQEKYSPESFLRSINIVLDARYPERVSHFHPTAKCVKLIRSLLAYEEERCFFFQAPYGSGKSLSACYLLHLIENREHSSHVLKLIQARLEVVSPELHKFSKVRLHRKDCGLVLLLHGFCSDLPRCLGIAAADAFRRLGLSAKSISRIQVDNMEGAISLLQRIEEMAAKAGLDRVVILWDEFGRHLESLLSEGSHSSLIEVQQIAEFAARSRKTPFALGLLLHQALTQYADNTSQAVRHEWQKVEGRFQTIAYIDDSQEIYRLVAEVVSSRKGERSQAPRVNFHREAELAQEQGLFREVPSEQLHALLAKAYPLEPTTLHLLPRLSARVAQSERTLFTFLYSQDLDREITPSDLYEYFSGAMRSDTSVGGTFKQWLETQSAISKTESKDEEDVLKTACLLMLGVSGERKKVSKAFLVYALQGYKSDKNVLRRVGSLIKRKLLLYRQHSNEVSVWHGTDVDLRSRLYEEMARHRIGFDLLRFLEVEASPPAWFSAQYNDDFYVRRYFRSHYHTERSLIEFLEGFEESKSLGEDSDGVVLYVLAESETDLNRLRKAVRKFRYGAQILVVIPKAPLDLLEAALEVRSLSHMEMDSALVELDPLVLTEIQQMQDDARSHLQNILDHFLLPGSMKTDWYHEGTKLRLKNARELQEHLSKTMAKVYPHTPRINNEMVVRRRLPSNVVNSRKKLVMGILERSGTPELGIQGNFPDMSMFRTVLLHTGLYREAQQSGRWRYASTDEIDDNGLRKVWEHIKKFFTVPSSSPKPFSELFRVLESPPYGVRSGVVPILLAAGYKAFPGAYSLSKEDAYISDILPSHIEDIFQNPEQYSLKVLDLDHKQKAYLKQFHNLFSTRSKDPAFSNDLIRSCYDAFEEWSFGLPPITRSTRQIGDDAMALREITQRSGDPIQTIFIEIPEAFARDVSNPSSALKRLKRAKLELESTVAQVQDAAVAMVAKVIAPGQVTQGNTLRAIGKRWANCFSEETLESFRDSVSKGFVASFKMPFDSDYKLVDSLASLITGKKMARWDDSTIIAFERSVTEVVHRIEEAAFAMNKCDFAKNGSAKALSSVICGRLNEQYERLVRLVGSEAARKVLYSMAEHTK